MCTCVMLFFAEKNIDGKLTVVFIPEAEDGESTSFIAFDHSLHSYDSNIEWHWHVDTTNIT